MDKVVVQKDFVYNNINDTMKFDIDHSANFDKKHPWLWLFSTTE